MIAPDKIYVLYERTGFLSHTFTNVPCGYKNSQDIEYIRKDALLEWIEETRAVPHENAITRDLAFQEVVNKLNSM